MKKVNTEECEIEKKTGGHYYTEGGSKMCCEENITKYQEKEFKDFVCAIEDLVREREVSFAYDDKEGFKKAEIELKETRIEFFKWFKKLIN